MTPELQVYEVQTRWLLGQVAHNLRDIPPALWVAPSPAGLEANNLLAIAKHAAAVTRGYALGIACGRDVHRDRSTEFSASAAEATGILVELDSLPAELAVGFEALHHPTLDVSVLPSHALYGAGQPREMTRREAIVENIRHLGIHLGEMRLTRSLLEAAARAD